MIHYVHLAIISSSRAFLIRLAISFFILYASPMSSSNKTRGCVHHRHPMTTSKGAPHAHHHVQAVRYVDTCSRCGAWRTRDVYPNGTVDTGKWVVRA